MTTIREIALQVCFKDGRQHALTLREDAPELRALFAALANPAGANQFVQVPAAGGRRACSFQLSHVVSIVSTPAVLLTFAEAGTAMPEPARLAPTVPLVPQARRSRVRHVVVDDFLNPEECDDLLAYALTPASHRLDFAETVHGRRFHNRLLMWLPLLTKTLGVRLFALAPLESRVTASADDSHGAAVRPSSDEAADDDCGLTCVYNLDDVHRQPRGSALGELRLSDRLEQGEVRQTASPALAIPLVANRMVVFFSDAFPAFGPTHAPTDPSAHRRLFVTTWLRRAPRLDPTKTFGLGHFRCAVVAPQFAGFDETKGEP